MHMAQATVMVGDEMTSPYVDECLDLGSHFCGGMTLVLEEEAVVWREGGRRAIYCSVMLSRIRWTAHATIGMRKWNWWNQGSTDPVQADSEKSALLTAW